MNNYHLKLIKHLLIIFSLILLLINPKFVLSENDESIFSKFNKTYPISRIEYNANRLSSDLEKEVFPNPKLYDNDFLETNTFCYARIYTLQISKYQDYSKKRLVFICKRENNYNTKKIKNLEGFVKGKHKGSYYATDVMAKRALSFFDNLSFRGYEYDNYVYKNLLRNFSNTLSSERYLDSDKMKLVKELSGNIFFIMEKSDNYGHEYRISASYIYPLNQYYEYADKKEDRKFERDVYSINFYPDKESFE